MKLTAAWIACLALLGPTASYAQVSDDVVKIGVLTDLSGIYSDLSGIGSVTAAEMAVEDFGGTVLGKKIEVVSADHQNKPDIGANVARSWYDRDKVDVIVDIPSSSVALAVLQVAKQRDKAVLFSSAGTSDLTGKDCSPISVQWTFDSYSLAHTVGTALLARGLDTWFIVTVDFAWGHSLERDTASLIKQKGGKLLGTVRYPQSASDMSSFLLQAQSSGAKVIGFASGGSDLVTLVKQANEFGLKKNGTQIVGILTYISDVHGMGLKDAQGLVLASAFYWDMNDETRAWSERFMSRVHKVPTMANAGVYGEVLHYLKAIKAAGTDKALEVVKKMKEIPIEDFFTKHGKVREDGRAIRDMYLFQVKTPEESKGQYDYYNLLSTVPGDQAFRPLAEGGCPMVSKVGPR